MGRATRFALLLHHAIHQRREKDHNNGDDNGADLFPAIQVTLRALMFIHDQNEPLYKSPKR
jgi:hypothetical protein